MTIHEAARIVYADLPPGVTDRDTSDDPASAPREWEQIGDEAQLSIATKWSRSVDANEALMDLALNGDLEYLNRSWLRFRDSELDRINGG